MIAVDTNVLIYAHRSEMPAHAVAHRRLTSLAEGRDPWGLPVFCLAEFCRVVTHPRVFNPPTQLAIALDALRSITASPSCRVLAPSERYVELFLQATQQGDAQGNLAFDAQIAALCREHGATDILTADRDFARFEGLRIVPLA